MTLDMLEVLIDALVSAMDLMSVADHYLGLVFIAFVLGLGTSLTFFLLFKELTLNFLSKNNR